MRNCILTVFNLPYLVKGSCVDYLPFFPLSRDQLAADDITLDAFGNFAYKIYERVLATGTGYFVEENTELNTIGTALYDNPVGQLAWIAAKIILWSDPRAGTNGSLINPEMTLNTVSLYYLTQAFANTDAPLLFSAFQYTNQYWLPEAVAMVGNLVSYTEHDFGGHSSGLDNPFGPLSDLIKIGDYFDIQ
ncbi:hypothetical protein D9757_010876 [Collybiopsis confluens]|uniref:Uncharacterized protein n=1 Tax=Collybiopsis confluens TaxID=2823264 RepID=A0A8H5H848_9AGAR|nr:hypothetical protein D9757_010876 [Collybiopsis confluens]